MSQERSTPQALYRQDVRRQVDRGRVYIWPPGSPDATEYMSVTTALDAVPKAALKFWAAKVVAETAVTSYELLGQLRDDDPEKAVTWLKGAPWSRRDKAALSGTSVHELCEAWLAGDEIAAQTIWNGIDVEGRRKGVQLKHFLDTMPLDFLHVEAVVYNLVAGYAGTIDLIAGTTDTALLRRLGLEGDSATLLLDIKTGSGIYAETALQLAAYRHATHMLDLDTCELVEMVSIDAAAAIHLSAESWALIPVRTDADAYFTFESALVLAQRLPLPDNLVGSPAARGVMVE